MSYRKLLNEMSKFLAQELFMPSVDILSPIYGRFLYYTFYPLFHSTFPHFIHLFYLPHSSVLHFTNSWPFVLSLKSVISQSIQLPKRWRKTRCEMRKMANEDVIHFYYTFSNDDRCTLMFQCFVLPA